VKREKFNAIRRIGEKCDAIKRINSEKCNVIRRSQYEEVQYNQKNQ
jgi:hypothetical protein